MDSLSNCPTCNHKLMTWDSRPHNGYGYATIKRKRKCVYCEYRIVTVEIPIELGNSIFLEDDHE